MKLSTWALKTDSLDPDPRSGFNVVSRELHTTHRLRAFNCLTGSHALSHSTACNSDPDRGRVEAKWSLNPDPRSALDADQSSVWRAPISPGFSSTKSCTLFVLVFGPGHCTFFVQIYPYVFVFVSACIRVTKSSRVLLSL